MVNKALELDMLNIIQGIEEFATMMSYQSNYAGVRILSIESPADYARKEKAQRDADNVISFESRVYKHGSSATVVSKQLSFKDA